MSHTVLLAFELPDGTAVSPEVTRDLAGMEIVVLGHFGLPEQTPPTAGRDQFEADAREELAELIRPLTDRGVDVTTRLVFGRDRAKTIDRIAVEERCDVVVVPGTNEPTAIDELFVPLRGEDNFAGVLSFAAELAIDCDASITVFHDAEESDRRPGEELLADATETLAANGVSRDRITTRLGTADDVETDIAERAGAFDAVVLGASEPSLRERVFGARPAAITLDIDTPAFVVRDLDSE